MDVYSHEHRVIVEAQELGEKLVKLKAFIGSENFESIVTDEDARKLLIEQDRHMEAYWMTLNKRIAKFKFDKIANMMENQ